MWDFWIELCGSCVNVATSSLDLFPDWNGTALASFLLRMFIINITNPSIMLRIFFVDMHSFAYVRSKDVINRMLMFLELSLIAPSHQLNVHNHLTVAGYDCHQPWIVQYIRWFDVTALQYSVPQQKLIHSYSWFLSNRSTYWRLDGGFQLYPAIDNAFQ